MRRRVGDGAPHGPVRDVGPAANRSGNLAGPGAGQRRIPPRSPVQRQRLAGATVRGISRRSWARPADESGQRPGEPVSAESPMPVKAGLKQADSASRRMSAGEGEGGARPRGHPVHGRNDRLRHRRQRARSGRSAPALSPDHLGVLVRRRVCSRDPDRREGAPDPGQDDGADRRVVGGRSGCRARRSLSRRRGRSSRPAGRSGRSARRRRRRRRRPWHLPRGPRRARCSWAPPDRRKGVGFARQCASSPASFRRRLTGRDNGPRTRSVPGAARRPATGTHDAGTRKGMPHGGHEAEDRRRPLEVTRRAAGPPWGLPSGAVEAGGRDDFGRGR